MKLRYVVPVLVLAILASVGGTARAASPNPTARQISALQKTVKLQAQEIASLKRQVSSFAGEIQSNTSQVGSLSGQVQTNTKDITTLGDTLVCQTAIFLTIDYGFVDGFDIIGGQPEQYAGQVAPDNGTCAAVGITPPSPAATVRQPAMTPLQADLTNIAFLLGVSKT